MDKMQIPLQLIYNNPHTVTYNTHKLIYSMCVGVRTKYILCIKCRKRYNDTVSVSRYTYRDKGGADGKIIATGGHILKNVYIKLHY